MRDADGGLRGWAFVRSVLAVGLVFPACQGKVRRYQLVDALQGPDSGASIPNGASDSPARGPGSPDDGSDHPLSTRQRSRAEIFRRAAPRMRDSRRDPRTRRARSARQSLVVPRRISACVSWASEPATVQDGASAKEQYFPEKGNAPRPRTTTAMGNQTTSWTTSAGARRAGGCTCVEGATVPCGPEGDVGVCRRGVSTCVNGAFSQCEGAVFPAARNCASSQDNDCDGRPDNTIDNTCTCIIGDVQVCGEHPGKDGNGPCRAGQQRCQEGANNVTSRFGACSGSVAPAFSDSCSARGDDANCDGVPNGSCQCISGQGNAACSQNPNASLCNFQGQCVPCQQNADCSLVGGGRSFCDQGRCIALLANGQPCSADRECSSGLCVLHYQDDDDYASATAGSATSALVVALTSRASPPGNLAPSIRRTASRAMRWCPQDKLAPSPNREIQAIPTIRCLMTITATAARTR